jgi:hypothetical protein
LSRDRNQADINLTKIRSALTNGSTLVADVDGRSAWMRRLRDIVHAHVADLGGEDAISHSERVLLNRSSMLTLQLEMMEAQWGKQDFNTTSRQLRDYQRAVNTVRRTFEALGLQRRSKDITPTLGELIRADQEAERQRLAAERQAEAEQEATS